MKDLWKYMTIFLGLLLIGSSLVTLHTQSKLQNKIIELQEQAPIVVEKYVHDTITFDSVQIKWRTKHDTAKFVTRDTLYSSDTVFIVQTEKCALDTFSVNERYQDSTIDATVNLKGRGVYEKTFVDSMSLDYTIKQTEVKKNCCWIKRLFGCCD